MNNLTDPPSALVAQIRKDRTTRAIIEEIYTAVESLDGDFLLLSAIGSWGDSLPDQAVLANLKVWNRDRTIDDK